MFYVYLFSKIIFIIFQNHHGDVQFQVKRGEQYDAGEGKGTKKKKNKSESFKVVTSLRDNLVQRFKSKSKRAAGDGDGDEDEEGRDRRKKNQAKMDEAPSLYECALCGPKKFKEFEVTILDNIEQEILKSRKKVEGLFLCKSHFRNEISNWRRLQTNCCNVLEKHTKPCKSKLVVVSLELAQTTKNFTNYLLIPDQKLCYPCKRRVSEAIEDEKTKRENEDMEQAEILADQQAQAAECKQTDTSWVPEEAEEENAKAKLDKIYEILNLPKLDMVEDTGISFMDKLNQLKGIASSLPNPNQDREQEIYKNIKEKWSGYDKKQRVTVLDILPDSLKHDEIVHLTGASSRLIKEVKKGDVQFERKQREDKFGADIQKMVADFMLDEKNSRHGAGMQEFVSVKTENGREPKQKHYLKTTLHQTYLNFKEEFPHIKIGLSKFKEFRPKWVIKYADQESGTQKCCCQEHENGSLLLDSTFVGELQKFKELFGLNPDDKVTLATVLQALLCGDSDTDSCWMNTCGDCLDRKESLLQGMVKMFQDLGDNMISYIQWAKEEEGNAILKLSFTVPIKAFCTDFMDKMYGLKRHDQVSIKQRNTAYNLRKNLPEKHCMVSLGKCSFFNFDFLQPFLCFLT